jgi:hypothetical protein
MDMHPVTIGLPDPLLRAAQDLAQRRDVNLGALIRAALSAEIRRASLPAKTPNRADERLVDPLRALLAGDFGEARDWPDLQARLTAKGFTLREAGGGLALHACADGTRLCKASELGHAYSSLMRRFGTPFPGHSHHGLTNRVLHEKAPLPDDGQGGHHISCDAG